MSEDEVTALPSTFSHLPIPSFSPDKAKPIAKRANYGVLRQSRLGSDRFRNDRGFDSEQLGDGITEFLHFCFNIFHDDCQGETEKGNSKKNKENIRKCRHRLGGTCTAIIVGCHGDCDWPPGTRTLPPWRSPLARCDAGSPRQGRVGKTPLRQRWQNRGVFVPSSMRQKGIQMTSCFITPRPSVWTDLISSASFNIAAIITSECFSFSLVPPR